MGVRPEPGAVEAGTAALAARARERATRVRLVWRYAGRSVEATGPLLGGWGRRVPLAPCARSGWAAEVWVRAPAARAPPGAFACACASPQMRMQGKRLMRPACKGAARRPLPASKHRLGRAFCAGLAAGAAPVQVHRRRHVDHRQRSACRVRAPRALYL